MDSVRSEYSDSSSTLGTGRFGGGNGSSGASFSFAESSSAGGSSSSRLSTTRSDFLSNYEHKFLARKAEKKKKREREKRLADASSNQLTADDRRRADRERERLARKAEMATWLPSPAALQQRDRERKKRSREALRSVLRWYPPLEEDETDARVAAATGTTPAALAEQRKRHTEIAPLFLADSAHARDAQREQQQRELRERIDQDASALQRRVADLQQKMACVERLQAARAARVSPHKLQQQQRRLAPLAATQSAVALPTYYASPRRRPRRDPHGASTSYLFRDTPDEAAAASAFEAAELDAFLDAHKRQRRRHAAARTIQATWRMVRVRRRFRRWRAWRTRHKRAFFQVWALAHRIARQAKRAATRKYLRAWREQVAGTVRLRLLELRLYREAELLPEVPKIVMNLVFMADDDDDAYTRKVLAHPMKPSYAAGFVNAAFASVESLATVSSRHRVRVLRAQHLEARRAVAKKIGQRVFLLWKRVHAEQLRLGLNAQLCIKRAARQAFQKRPVWAGEKLLTVFELWARWAAFARSKRLRVPMPHFSRALPLWDVWLHNYQERQVRKVKAAAKAPLARMKRCFRGFRAFAAYALRKRLAFERATHHFASTATRAVLLAWRDAIAESAAHKKLLRAVLHNWLAYAKRKRAMRPWKREIQAARLRREQQRAWGAWRNVQLRSCFKRELHRARLASQPAWRWKVQRLLLVWMDLREPLRRWKCFVAWRHAVQRRKLFLTVRTHCHALRRKHLMYGVFSAWKAVVWKQEDEFLEDRLQLSAWDTYKELSPLLPMLFYGCFSDAAAIFAGVPTTLTAGTANAISVIAPTTSVPPTPETDDVLPRRQRDVRAFHEALLQGSVIEARNLILNQRHLVNAVDESTGNTALHVAAGQLEDPVRRVEILTLLLSEGACTWDKPNRHGLKPAQLAPQDVDGDATRRLLARGVYEFHAEGVLQRARREPSPASDFAESRLVWCLVARMSSEYVRGERVAGDLRREWFSELLDELWLRRGRVCFASASTFTAAIHRCRAFLNGMKRRICRSKEDVLQDLWTRARAQPRPRSRAGSSSGSASRRPTLVKSTTRRTLSRNLARMEEKIDLLTWLKNTPDDPSSPEAIQKAREQQAEEATREKALTLGEYGAYAEALLWPVLHDEAAERQLVHSFVGVLFSLAFPVEVVLAEAAQLEEDCTQLENTVLHGFQAIMSAELRCRGPERPHGMPLLRYFTEQSDAEFFFKRELLLLDLALIRRRQQRQGDSMSTSEEQELVEDGDAQESPSPPRDASELQLEAEILLAKAQRKQRKVDKKVAASELQVTALTDANARVLLRTPLDPSQSRLREICDARTRLEDERLRLANLRLKQLDWAEKSAEMGALKRALQGLEPLPPPQEDEPVDDDELLAKRVFLEEQLKWYTQELKPLGSSRAGTTAAAQSPTTELRRLHKAASSTLWALFIKNLFRSCTFWLAENLLKFQEQESQEEMPAGMIDGEQEEGDEALEFVEEVVDEDDGVVKDNSGAMVVLRRKTVVAPAKRVSVATIGEPVTAAVATTFAAARKASAVAHAPAGAGRRRSSVQNARATLDTMQRSAAAAELAEIQTQMMRDNYATSSHLLFESDRDAILEDERLASQREMLESQQYAGRSMSAVAEFNPMTGLPETPSSRLMDAEEVAALVDTMAQAAAEEDRAAVAATKRNRKRELLRRAMAQRQLQRLAARQHNSAIEEEEATGDQPSDGAKITVEDGSASRKKWEPLVDGVIESEVDGAFAFGNFVLGSTDALSSTQPIVSPTTSSTVHKTVAAAMAESLWKRGGTVRRPGDAPSSAAGGGLSSSPSSSSPSSAARGDNFELFASAEDELAFNAAFRVMSASKERRATPNGRRLSSIGAVAGGGLSAGSPQESLGDVDSGAAIEEPPSDEAREELSTLLAELHASADAEQIEMGSEARDAADEEEPTRDDGAEVECEEERDAPVAVRDAGKDARLRTDLASLVSVADETEFFDQTLQHYLMRVRQDSFVGPKHLKDFSDEHASILLQAPADSDHTLPTHGGTGEADDAGTDSMAELTDDACDTAIENSLRTPHIKWESTSDERHLHPPRPLHVESTRLLIPSAAPVSSGDGASQRETALLLEALRELERKQEDEQRQRQLQGEPLLLSGKTSTMAMRRQKSSVVSTLLKKDAPRRVTGCDANTISLGFAQLASVEDKPASPSVPKVMVAIQRKARNDEAPVHQDPTQAAIQEAGTEPPSPTRRLSQQQPLPMAHCEVRLERAKTFSKTKKPVAAASRRRTSQVDPEQKAVPLSLKRQPSRLPVAPVDFCLEGASALAAPVEAKEVGDATALAEATSEPAVIVPELTEEQKRNIWRQFTAEPLSDAMQDAYAQLYPHLYEPMTPLPSMPATPLLENQRRPSSVSATSDVVSATPAEVPLTQQIALDKRFWSAVEGFKAVGGGAAALVPLDEKTAQRRRIETAVAIYQQFLGPAAPSRLPWLSMYSDELRAVERRLLAAPRALFDALQQSAQLHISTLQAQQRQHGYTL